MTSSSQISNNVQGEGVAFTAAQIAACIGVTPQAIRKALRGIEAASIKIVCGIDTAAWRFEQLPEKLRQRLQEEAARRGCYRNAQAMLSSPPQIWQPSLSLNNVRSNDIESARKLQVAIKPWLAQQHTLELSAAEIEQRGVEDYYRAFGHRISYRYWRELFMRTLKRDAGAENWNRLEIYLPDKLTPKASPCRVVLDELVERFAGLDSFIVSCSNPVAPTETECRGIWTLVLDEYSKLLPSMTPKKAARCLRDYLFAKAPFLAPSRDALLKSFQRKLAVFEKSGGDPKVLRDGRENNGDKFELPDQDRDLLIHRAVFYYRGQVAPAWRDCMSKGFSDEVRDRYPSASRKSYVPASVIESVLPEVEILTVIYQGKRAFDSIKGHVNRSYEGIHSLVCMSADDFTMPVYYYVPDGNGWFNLTRGQILLFIDFRSLRIVGWSMQPDRNYSSLTIRSLCTHVFAEFGIPDILQFERGIWESSLILKGRPAPLQFTEVAQGLREFGIRFIHSIRPRSKVVERVGGLLQDLMEGEPGYCGRDERRDCPEELRKQMQAVTARKAHPSEFLYNFSSWFKRFGEIVSKYNAAPQQGRVLQGLSPDEALAKFADVENPPIQLGAQVRYLLAHEKRPTCVTLDGVKFTVGKKQFKYRGNQIAHLVGRDVLVWFDPENSDSVVVTDMQRNNPIWVPRSEEPSALECLVAPDSGTLAREMQRIEEQASYMKTRFQTVKSKFPLPQRQLLVDAKTLELGKTIETRRKAAADDRAAKSVRVSTMRKKAERMGISPVLIDDTEAHKEGLNLIESVRRKIQRDKKDYTLNPAKTYTPKPDAQEGSR